MEPFLFSNRLDEGVNRKRNDKMRQMLNFKANKCIWTKCVYLYCLNSWEPFMLEKSVEEAFSKWANAIYVQTEIPHFYC